MCSSVVERCPDKTEVEGSIPSTRTQGGIFIKFENSLPVIRQRSKVRFLPHAHSAVAYLLEEAEDSISSM